MVVVVERWVRASNANCSRCTSRTGKLANRAYWGIFSRISCRILVVAARATRGTHSRGKVQNWCCTVLIAFSAVWRKNRTFTTGCCTGIASERRDRQISSCRTTTETFWLIEVDLRSESSGSEAWKTGGREGARITGNSAIWLPTDTVVLAG